MYPSLKYRAAVDNRQNKLCVNMHYIIPPHLISREGLPHHSSKASILASICSSVQCLRVMARAGHSTTQIPQPRHLAGGISETPSEVIKGAAKGQDRTQSRQAAQRSGSTTATVAGVLIISLQRILAACWAAPLAMARASGMNLGLWARPARKIPGEANSRGCSLT